MAGIQVKGFFLRWIGFLVVLEGIALLWMLSYDYGPPPSSSATSSLRPPARTTPAPRIHFPSSPTDHYFFSRISLARDSCHRLDQLQGNLNTPQLWEHCMDDLQRASKAYWKHHPFPTEEEECKNTQPHLYHTTWSGPLVDTARLGLESILQHRGPCAHVMLWVTNQEDELALKKEFHNTTALSIQPLDFEDLIHRIVQQHHPSLEFLLNEARPQLLALNHPPNDDATGFSDVVRLFVLCAYGGTYLDVDMLLLQPLTPLLTRDFVYRWSATHYVNTAVFHLQPNSANGPKLLQACLLESMEKGQEGSRVLNPYELTRAVHPHFISSLLKQIPNLSIDVLPSAYFDPLWVVHDNYGAARPAALQRYGLDSYHDFFRAPNVHPDIHRKNVTRIFFDGAFCFHWHNQWQTPIVRNSTADWFARHWWGSDWKPSPVPYVNVPISFFNLFWNATDDDSSKRSDYDDDKGYL